MPSKTTRNEQRPWLLKKIARKTVVNYGSQRMEEDGGEEERRVTNVQQVTHSKTSNDGMAARDEAMAAAAQLEIISKLTL